MNLYLAQQLMLCSDLELLAILVLYLTVHTSAIPRNRPRFKPQYSTSIGNESLVNIPRCIVPLAASHEALSIKY
jgi:hypothetical protein